MKKNITILMIVMLCVSSWSMGNLYQLTLDVSGKLEIDGLADQDVKAGYSIISEFPLTKLGGFNLGIGTEYQFDRDLDGAAGEFRFWNKYITLRKPLFKNGFHSLTPVIKLGVADVTSNLGLKDEGYFYSVGFQYRLNSIGQAEITYSVNQAETSTGNDVDYKKINFTWGTRFDGLYNAKKQYDKFN